MWWLSGPQDLHRIEDRLSTLYAERCHVDRDDNAVVLVNKERTVRVPAAFVASLLLGPGTRVTHAAIRLLADSGTAVCWVGERGVRMYATGLGPSRGAELLMRQAYLVTRVVPARAGVIRSTGASPRGRGCRPRPRGGHSCLYGICHAAIVGLGASPALGFVHTGGAVSFVLDIADLYKAEYTIPLAFDLAACGRTDERSIRTAFRDKVADGALMGRVVRDIKDLLLGQGRETSDQDNLHLWDEFDGHVAGGINWAADYADGFDADSYAAVTGPDLDEPQVPW